MLYYAVSTWVYCTLFVIFWCLCLSVFMTVRCAVIHELQLHVLLQATLHKLCVRYMMFLLEYLELLIHTDKKQSWKLLATGHRCIICDDVLLLVHSITMQHLLLCSWCHLVPQTDYELQTLDKIAKDWWCFSGCSCGATTLSLFFVFFFVFFAF